MSHQIKKYSIKRGIHLYININNLDKLIINEEQNNTNLSRVFYAMDAYLSTIEYFIKKFGETVYVEKLTNSRIHIVFYDSNNLDSKFIDTVKFAFKLSKYLRKNSNGKFDKLEDFTIGMGADYGFFTEFDFIDDDTKITYTENTSIGYPANRAAKLQSNAKDGEIIISKEVFDILKYSRQIFRQGTVSLNESLRKKYEGISTFISNGDWTDFESTDNRLFDGNFADSLNFLLQKTVSNLSDIDFTSANQKIDFSILSLKQSKKIESVVIYADIRGFTKKFDKNGNNLSEMANKTINILRRMFICVKNGDGTHVQFQGDRESGLRNRFGDKNYLVDGLLIALNMIKEVKQSGESIEIGVGCSCGTVFATRIGVRDEKDNLILGETVRHADYAEDDIAETNQIAITKKMYDELLRVPDFVVVKTVKKIFTKSHKNNNYYVTNEDIDGWRKNYNIVKEENNADNAKKNNDLRPWRS